MSLPLPYSVFFFFHDALQEPKNDHLNTRKVNILFIIWYLRHPSQLDHIQVYMNEEIIARNVSELVLGTYLFPHKHLLPDFTDKQINQFINARPKLGEFSVLSGIVYWHGENITNMKLVCLTTGVKCVPDNKLQNSNGKIIHDMHAEILSMRAFSWYIMDEIEKVKGGETSDLVKIDSLGGYRLEDEVKIALYVSELPCGDCSLDEMIRLDPLPWTEIPSETLRGRSSYTQVGIVRTKPGRKDSPLASSKSCSDKLAIVTMKGLLKGVIADLLTNDKVLLEYIVLPRNKVLENISSLERCFERRVNVGEGDFYHKFKILKCPNDITVRYNDLLGEKNLGVLSIDRAKKRKACDLSIVCIPPSKIIEVINGGVKNGNNLKNVLKTGRGSSFMCRYSMYQKRIQLDRNHDAFKTYFDWKRRDGNVKYNEEVRRAKKSVGSWGETIKDNFALEIHLKTT